MVRKLSLIMTAAILMTLLLCTQSYAASINDVIYDESTLMRSSEEFLVAITRPEGDETAFKQSYVICGNTEPKDIRVELAIVNKNGELEPFLNTDGESGWDVGESGIFMKEVILPSMGVNVIRIAAFKKSEASDPKPGWNLQINDYTITVREESFKE